MKPHGISRNWIALGILLIPVIALAESGMCPYGFVVSRRSAYAESMAKFKPQYRRLLFIDRKIHEGGYPNCRGLAGEWEVSAKTIQRDIDYLRDELDAPIEYDAERHGYRYTEENYRLPAISISESDLFAVCIAEKALVQFEQTPLYGRLRSVFDKIEQALPGRVTVHPGWIDGRISFRPGASTHIRPEVWDIMAAALRTNRRVRLEHRSPGRSRATGHEVDPYHLVNYRGEWYLIAYSHTRSEIRTFALSRIGQAGLLDVQFEIPESWERERWLGDDFGIIRGDETHKVRIRFDARRAPYIRERQWHATQAIKELRNDALELSFRTSYLAEVKDWVLSWGRGARVLGPRILVDRVKKDLRKALDGYTRS